MMGSKPRLLLVIFAAALLTTLLSGCGGGGNPPAPATSGSTPSPAVQMPAPASPVGAQSSAELMVAFQQMQMAVMTFRNMEAANTSSSGLLWAAGYVAASNDMRKKREVFENMLAQTNANDVPQIDEIRKAYVPVGKDLKAYIMVTNVNGVLGGPDAKASTLNYGLFAVKALKFTKTVSTLQATAVTQSIATGNDIVAADKALKDAYEKYYGLVNEGGDPVQVKAAAGEVEKAKIRLQQAQGR